MDKKVSMCLLQRIESIVDSLTVTACCKRSNSLTTARRSAGLPKPHTMRCGVLGFHTSQASHIYRFPAVAVFIFKLFCVYKQQEKLKESNIQALELKERRACHGNSIRLHRRIQELQVLHKFWQNTGWRHTSKLVDIFSTMSLRSGANWLMSAGINQE